MASSTRVVAMEHCNLQLGMDLMMYLPAIITCVIAFPLDEVLETVIPHATIKDFLDFIFVLAVDDSWRWRRGMSTGVGECWHERHLLH
jgi:hypothetical protein